MVSGHRVQGPADRNSPRPPGAARADCARPASGTQLTLVVEGELDLATVPDLRTRLADALRRRPDRLALDLSRCTFADCTALALLLDASRAADRQGTGLVVQHPSGPVRRLLDQTGTFRALQVEQDA